MPSGRERDFSEILGGVVRVKPAVTKTSENILTSRAEKALLEGARRKAIEKVAELERKYGRIVLPAVRVCVIEEIRKTYYVHAKRSVEKILKEKGVPGMRISFPELVIDRSGYIALRAHFKRLIENAH